MFRLLAILGIVAGSVYMGIHASLKLKHRREIILALENDIMQLSIGMDFLAKPLAELTLRFCSPATEIFWAAFRDELKLEGDVPKAWQNAMNTAKKQDAGFAALKKEELKILEEYAQSLGASDRTAQLKNATMAQKRLDAVGGEAKEEYDRKGRLYLSMGVLCGIAIAILLW
ncbi:stage III sporulation protein AB [Eubacteriales bacterium OttesenSCG-928-K08]|nr:stage III sporulation protein AB [Eubacteriales bacterium OttesenSCG-928-K08]